MKKKLLLFRLLLMITAWAVSFPIMASVKWYQYNVHCAISPTGLGSVYLSNDYDSDTSLSYQKVVKEESDITFTFQVESIPSGYFFLGWSEDKEAKSYSDIISTDNPYSLKVYGSYRGELSSAPTFDDENGNQDRYYANFTSVKVQSQNEAEGKAYFMDDIPIQVELGTNVRLLAEAVRGYKFKEWRKGDEVVSSENPFRFTSNETTSGIYTAYFEESSESSEASAYNVVIDKHSHGDITIDKTTATSGDDVTVTVSSDVGYETVEVRCNYFLADKVNDITYMFTMPNFDAYVSQTCAPIIYTITYNLNGGTMATDNPTEFTVETETFTLTPPTREGYSFAGWKSKDSAEPIQTVTITKGSTDNRTYIASWTPIH